jgi:hypothetical protein
MIEKRIAFTSSMEHSLSHAARLRQRVAAEDWRGPSGAALSCLSFGVGRPVMIDDFRDGRKWYLDNFATGHFHLQARRGQGLCGFHAADNAAHAIAVRGDDLHVIMAIEWLECCEGFGDFHCLCTALSEVLRLKYARLWPDGCIKSALHRSRTFRHASGTARARCAHVLPY